MFGTINAVTERKVFFPEAPADETDDLDRAAARRAEQIANTRLSIMMAAARVVAQNGYSAATMRSIAKEAGFTASSLYTYFSSKEEVFSAMRQEIFAAVAEMLQRDIPSELDFRSRISILAHRIELLTTRFRDAFMLHLLGAGQMPSDNLDHRMQMMQLQIQQMTTWFERFSSLEERHGHSAETAAVLFHGIQSTFAKQQVINERLRESPSASPMSPTLSNDFFLAALQGNPMPNPLNPTQQNAPVA